MIPLVRIKLIGHTFTHLVDFPYYVRIVVFLDVGRRHVQCRQVVKYFRFKFVRLLRIVPLPHLSLARTSGSYICLAHQVCEVSTQTWARVQLGVGVCGDCMYSNLLCLEKFYSVQFLFYYM